MIYKIKGGYMKNPVTALLVVFCFILTAGIIHAEDWNKVKY